MQYMVVFLADISKKYYLCRYNVTIKLADRWKTNTIGVTDEAINVDDIIETTNHFRAVDYIIQENDGKLTETYIKQLHFILKSGTSEERKEMFYYNGLRHWPHIKGYLADTCLTAQDHFKVLLEKFHIKYDHNYICFRTFAENLQLCRHFSLSSSVFILRETSIYSGEGHRLW